MATCGVNRIYMDALMLKISRTTIMIMKENQALMKNITAIRAWKME